jgi:hypothetical protein
MPDATTPQVEVDVRYSTRTPPGDKTHYMTRARGDRLDVLLTIEAMRLLYGCQTVTPAERERERERERNEIASAAARPRTRSPSSCSPPAGSTSTPPPGDRSHLERAFAAAGITGARIVEPGK